MTSNQEHRASQILGFVNLTLKKLPNNGKASKEHAQYLIYCAMCDEKDPIVIEHCNAKFREWYNCEG